MERIIETLKYDWQFARGEIAGAESSDCTYTGWQTVRVPHDWAIEGPFDSMNDRGNLIASADGTMVNLSVTGRTGALPIVGTGWYRRELFIDAAWEGREISLEFDGVMSHSQV